MPSVYDLKPRFQALLRPGTRWLASHGVSANQVTIAAVLLSILSGAAIAWAPSGSWPLLFLPAVLLTRMGLNAIDGMLAREHDQQTKLGALLNELGDVISDSVMYLPLAWIPDVPAVLVVSLVVAAVVVEMTGVVAVQIGASRRYDGPMGKSDRALLFGTLALLLGLGVTPGSWLSVVLGLALLASLYTVFNRSRAALAEARA